MATTATLATNHGDIRINLFLTLIEVDYTSLELSTSDSFHGRSRKNGVSEHDKTKSL